jgi:hypothetical protein
MEKFYNADKDDNFDKIFRDKLFDFDANPQPDAFDKIFEKTSRKKKNYFGFRAVVLTSLFIFLALGAFFWLKNEQTNKSDKLLHKANEANILPENNLGSSENSAIIAEKIENNTDKSLKNEAEHKPEKVTSKLVVTPQKGTKSPSNAKSERRTPLSEWNKKDILPSEKLPAKAENELLNADKKQLFSGEKSKTEVDIFKDIALISEFPAPLLTTLGVQTEGVFVGNISAKNSEIINKRKHSALGKNVYAAVEAGFSANFITADVNLPENIKVEKYSLKTIAARQLGVSLRTSLTHKLSLTASAKHFFIHEQANVREANSQPDDFFRKKTGDLNLDCSPVYNYEEKTYTFKADYLKIGIGIRHDKEISPVVSRFFALQINHMSLLREQQSAQKPSISSAGNGQLGETVLVKNLFSSEIQGGLLFSLNSRCRLSAAASVTNFATPFTRGAQEITMQNVALNVGLEVKLR